MKKYKRKALQIIICSIIAFILVNWMLSRLITAEVDTVWMDLWIVIVVISNLVIVTATYENLKDNAELFRIEKEIKKLERRMKNV